MTGNLAIEETRMRLRFVGTNSSGGNCPAVYETDHGTVVVQGWKLEDPEALSDLRDLAANETAVEIPKELLQYFRDVEE
jgi:hypothetical protein